MSADATVVVVTWQGRHLLEPCLDALTAQTLPPGRFTTVVVDNASTDGTAELLAARGIATMRAPRNLGFAGGATLALAEVTTPYAVVLNNDAQPDPDWLEQLLSSFTPGVAAVTSKVLLTPRYVQVDVPATVEELGRVTVDGLDVTTTVVAWATNNGWQLAVPVPDGIEAHITMHAIDGKPATSQVIGTSCARMDVLNSTGGELTPTGHGADRGYLDVDHGQYDEHLDVFAFCGAAAAIRTDVGAALGWFDPWLFAYYEDLDLSWRMRRAGWAVRYAPRARVRHRHAATSRIGSPVFQFHNQRNRLAVLTRNATAAELLQVVAASRQPRHRPSALLLGSIPAPSRSQQVKSRTSALGSYAARLPRLLRDRRRPSLNR